MYRSVAIDIKEEAVQLRIENAQLLLPNVDTVYPLYQAILCSAAQYTNQFGAMTPPHEFSFDVIVSNPPYIPLADMPSLTDDVVKYEDIDALCGGVDGMDVIRNIIQRLEEWCRLNPKYTAETDHETVRIESMCWMEVDPSQPPLIQQMLSSSSSNPKVQYMETRKDSSGNDRFIKLAIHRP